MNLLYLVPFWPYLYTPYLYREVAWWRRNGDRVVVVSLNDPPGPAADLSVYEGLEGLPVLQVRRQYTSDRKLVASLASLPPRDWPRATGAQARRAVRGAGVRQGLFEWSAFRHVVAFARRHRVDVVDAHWASQAASLAVLLKQETGLPFAVRLHGSDVHSRPSPDLPRIIQHASAVCPVSQFLADLLLGRRQLPGLDVLKNLPLDPSRLRVCHNGILEELVNDAPLPQSDRSQCVVSIGRLDPEKRQADIVAAVANLAGRFPGLRLLLIGGGQLEPALRGQARELGIADRVEITGDQPGTRVPALARGGHVYVQATDLEGFGLATLEGAAQGMPVIATDTGAHAQIAIDGINGFLYPAGDVAALTDALARVLAKSPEERQAMGQASLRIVRERFLFSQQMARQRRLLQAVRDGQPLPD